MADRPKSTVSTVSHVTGKTDQTSTSSGSSVVPAHKSWTAFTGPVVFTGPSGLRDFRVSTKHGFQMVGENDRSTEVTSEMGYLNRPAPGASFPKAKNGSVGEIGWVYDHLKVVHGI